MTKPSVKVPQAVPDPAKKLFWKAVGAIFILGLIIYAGILKSEFQFDDWKELQEGYALRQFPNLGAIWNFAPARFLTYLTFSLNFYFHGLNVVSYHLTGLFLHMLTAVFVFLFCGQILKTPAVKKETPAAGSFLYCLAAALVFTVHPIQTQAVTYIIQRAAVLAALGYIACLYFYLRWRMEGRTSFYAASVSICFAAMFTKQNAFTLPLAVLLCEFIFLGGWQGIKEKIRKLVPFLSALLVHPVLLIFYRISSTLTPVGEGSGISVKDYFLTQLNVLVTYLRLLVLPVGQNIDYDYPIAHSLAGPTFFSLLFLAGLFALGVFLHKKQRILSFCIFWFFLTLSVESSFLPIKDVIFEHRLYLPMAGFALFTAYILGIFLKDAKKFSIGAGIIIFLFSGLTCARNHVWKDGIRLWKDASEKSPKKARPFHNLAFLYSARGNYGKAVEYGLMAVARNPDSSGPYMTLGVAYGRMGDYDREIEYYEEAFKRGAWQPAKYYNNLGSAYARKGDLAGAESNFRKAIEVDPSYPPTYANLGFAYDQRQFYDEAIKEYEKAIRLDPNFAEAYNFTAIAYAKKGKTDEAFPFAEKSVRLRPDYADAYNTLGLLYGQKQDLNKMIECLEKAIKLDPRFFKAYENLAKAYEQKGDIQKAVFYASKLIQAPQKPS